MAINNVPITSNQTWNWPTGVVYATIEAEGASGGSGGVSGNPAAGGGGMGGGYASKNVTKGAEAGLVWVLGAAGGLGAATGANGTAGGYTEVTQGGVAILRATGGDFGRGGTTATGFAGGTTANGTALGDVVHNGGSGGTGSQSGTFVGGGGGGGGGPTANGGAATGQTGGSRGAGTWLDGTSKNSAGNNGPGANSAGTAGINYGGGAGGGMANASANRAGAAGVAGVGLVSYYQPAISAADSPVADGDITYTSLFTDNFNRANETPLASPWNNLATGSSFNLVSNTARPASLSQSIASRWSGAGAAQWAEAKVSITGSGGNGGIGVFLRGADSVSGYAITTDDAGNITITRFINGGGTDLTTFSTGTWVSGDTLKAQIIGWTIKVFRNGSLVGTHTDTDHTNTTGDIGIAYLGDLSVSAAQLDDFDGGDITGKTVTGTDFPTAETGSAKLELGSASDYTGTKVTQTVISWTSTVITYTVVKGALSTGTVYAFVTDANGNRNATGFSITLQAAATDVFIENCLDCIEQGMKAISAARMGGVLTE